MVLITIKSISIVFIKKYFLILLILICVSVGLREHSLSWIPISASHLHALSSIIIIIIIILIIMMIIVIAIIRIFIIDNIDELP